MATEDTHVSRPWVNVRMTESSLERHELHVVVEAADEQSLAIRRQAEVSGARLHERYRSNQFAGRKVPDEHLMLAGATQHCLPIHGHRDATNRALALPTAKQCSADDIPNGDRAVLVPRDDRPVVWRQCQRRHFGLAHGEDEPLRLA